MAAKADTRLRSVWSEAVELSRHVAEYRWAAPAMLALGVAAAFAEAISISVAVLFLFAILGETDRLGEGPLSAVLERLGAMGFDTVAMALVFVCLILVNAALIYAYQLITANLMNRVAERMRERVHDTYLRVGYIYLQKRDRGALIHTLSTETWSVSEALYSLSRIAIGLATVAVFGIALVALSWEIALTALVCALGAFMLQRVLARRLRRYSEEMLAENRVLSERMLISLNGMRTLRAFGQEGYASEVFSQVSGRVRRLAVQLETVKALLRPMGEVVGLLTLVLIVLVARQASVGVPTTVAAVLLLLRLQPHLREVEGHRLSLASLAASLRTVRETLERDDKPWPREGREPLGGIGEAIRFEGVSFVHDPRRGPSLDKVSFPIRKGLVTAISGPSGSGKTTIINLLLRIYEPDRGRVTVDGRDLAAFSRESWLDKVSIAGQDVELIEGTVADNLLLARRGASREELEDVCRLAEISGDLAAIPEGLDARIGPGGLSFSGGQRQRLGLARAFLRNPEVLILDEATSAMEPALEARIKERLRARMQGRTVIVISHRETAAAEADVVIRIERGRVVEITGPGDPDARS